jgi:uncharacterized protein (DUF1800 family)
MKWPAFKFPISLARLSACFSRSCLLLCSLIPAHAAPTTLWQIGDDEDPYGANYEPTNEFSRETGDSNPPPGLVTRLIGDPLFQASSNPERDDHFYQAGIYPVGFNGLTSTLTVPNPEPLSVFERALSNTDPTNLIHFNLTAAQAGPLSRLRLSFELVSGGSWSEATGNGENFGTHDITARFRTASHNTLILNRHGVNRNTRFTLDIPASSVNAAAGANTLEIRRLGPSLPPAHYTWIQFDFVKFEVDPDGMADSDSDGLPRWWEVDNHLSDDLASDAFSDQDQDGLSAFQEYNNGQLSSDPNLHDTDSDEASDSVERNAGSSPNLADTDGDGLSDSDEISKSPTSSPIQVDTDSDGATDAWEKRVGSDPRSIASVPPPFRGAIGLNFVSADDLEGSVAWLKPAGVVPQQYWNNTVPLRSYSRPSGSSVDFDTPTAGVITRSDGQVVPGMTAEWTSADTSSSANKGSPDQSLMNGFLRAYQDRQVTLTLQGIPFTNYHIFAYVGGGYDGQTASVRLNDDPTTNRFFITHTTPPHRDWVEILPPTPDIPTPRANFVHYGSRSGSAVTIHVSNVDGYSLGLHALQIVDATLDADGSGIPDWYEITYALQPTTTNTATTDLDADGLSNLQEFQRGSNPRNIDTDGDGLSDSAEPPSNVLTIDSDGDGLSDYTETRNPLPSNPNLVDTNDDGISDKEAARIGFDPVSSARYVPSYSAMPGTWEWVISPVQLVWDHQAGMLGGNNGFEDTLVSFRVGNSTVSSGSSLDLRLRSVNGLLTYQFESSRDDAFSAGDQPNSNIYLVDPNSPATDLTAALGFSGYGTTDCSDRLRFRMLASQTSPGKWAVTFEIFNLTRNRSIVSRLVSESSAVPSLETGTAIWQDSEQNSGRPTVEIHTGIQLFVSPIPVETLPAFSAYADADDDAMPDAWEHTYQFNIASKTDASLDADGDGLTNRDEYLAGTHPRNIDTDGDGIDDRVERAEGANPLVAQLRPNFIAGAQSTGTDFNRNGFSDAWEAKFHVQNLSPNADVDSDGMSNTEEAASGTDPYDSASKISLALSRQGQDAMLAWTRSPWKRQRLKRSTDLSSWQALNIAITPTGGNDTARLNSSFTTTPTAFFTIETKDRDSDGDGVSDWDEVFAASDPFRRDSSRTSSLILDAEGSVSGTVSGDYASFSNRFKNTLPGGPGGSITPEQAARFLQQASFGPTLAEIERVQTLGYEAWIDDQISNQTPTLHRPYIESIIRDVRGPRLDLSYRYDDSQNVGGSNTTTAFARGAIAGKDQLRQRVAFALSQILVASQRDPNLEGRPLAMTDFYDIFTREGLGNYRDILTQVSLHPVMGRYLSQVGNQKARPEINQFPDENYAREIMQLFTIGLWQLHPDGSRKLDLQGRDIPTYDNSDITQLARVFTGLWFGGQNWGSGGYDDIQLSVPMALWPEKHDFEAKQLLNGLTIPARAPSVVNGLRDIQESIDFLFMHPNTPPFISRQLIQFLVTSNPSPAYVGRVSAVFSNNGRGKRGDLAATVRAILLDSEARDIRWSLGSESFGRLKDPVQRSMGIARIGHLDRFPGGVNWWDYGDFYNSALQSPGNAPSVFNFYRPDYRPPGLLTQSELVGPSFQITNSYSSISFVNRLWQLTSSGLGVYGRKQFSPDYRDLLQVAADPALLLDRTNLLVCGGMMSAATRDNILGALSKTSAADPLLRVQLSVFLASAAPEGAIQR